MTTTELVAKYVCICRGFATSHHKIQNAALLHTVSDFLSVFECIKCNKWQIDRIGAVLYLLLLVLKVDLYPRQTLESTSQLILNPTYFRLADTMNVCNSGVMEGWEFR
jgi:hypothetical protein